MMKINKTVFLLAMTFGFGLNSSAFAKAPRLGICERGILAAVGATYPGFELALKDSDRKPFYGFEAGRYVEGGPLQLSVVLRISNKTFYYFEPCDICASLWVCEWASERGLGYSYEFKGAHALGCEDLPQVDPKEIRYTACL